MPQRASVVFPPSVALLYGRKGRKGREDLFDEYLASEHLARIKAALGETAATSDLEAADADLADVLDEVSTPPLWGSSRLIILRGAEAILSPPRGERERLEPLVKRMAAMAVNPNPPGRLVLMATGLAFEGRTPKSQFPPVQGLITAISRSGGLLSCLPPYEREIKNRLVRAARESGATLTGAAADLLLAMVGTDQMALSEELDKLLTAAGDGGRITPEDVHALASAVPDRNVFALAEIILDGNAPAALEALRSLRETPATRSSAFITGAIAGTFRRYLASASRVEKGVTARAAAAASRVPARYQEDFARRLEKWPARSLRSLLGRLLQTDVDIKTGTVSEEVALEAFIVDACSLTLEAAELVGGWLYEI